MSQDQVIHALAWDERVRVIAASMTQTIREAVRVHETEATASAALGRTLIGARLMQASVKDTERITIQVKGSGPTGLIVGRAVPGGDVFGSIFNPKVHLPPRADGSLDVGNAVGPQGEMIVVRDTGRYAEPYIGVTQLVSGEIGDDLANYLLTSEQIKSAVIVGVMMGPDRQVLGAGGVLIQILGGLEDDEVARLENRVYALQNISQLMSDGASAESVINAVFGDDLRILDTKEARYHCDRGRAYYVNALGRMSAGSLREIFEDDEQIELTCEFTRETFTIRRDEFPQLST